MLVECAHAPICCGCYVFLFNFSQSPRTGETQSMALRCPQSWSIFDRRLCVSGALFFFWWRAGGAFLGNLVVGDGRRLSSVPTRLSVAAATCLCSFPPPIVAHPAHGIEVSPIMVDVRSSFVCLGCSFLLLVARWWRVFGKLGRWRWKMLVECANAPV